MLRRHAQSIQMPAAGLIIRAFGRPEVIVNGRLVPMSEWRTQSVRDLFFYFLYRQEFVTKEKIGAALWPETEDPQMLKARFKNEIYRLRRVVGRSAIIFEEEYYCFNRSLDYEYDVEAFDAHIARARKSRDVKERIQYLQKAVDLVRGAYLSGVDASWADLERERLAQVHASALVDLARLYLDTSQLSKSLAICQQVLKQDRCNETIYQLEMRVYAALGDRAAVIRRYQACKTALHEEWGLPPSPETQEIYRELTQ
jgi:two-component SAPR family response regulator